MIILEEPGSGEIFLQNTPIVNINGSLGRSMGEHIRDSIVSSTVGKFFGWLAGKTNPS
jgi:hypothetical protein